MGADQDPNNGSKKEKQLHEMLMRTTHDNQQLKQQLQAMIQINSAQQMQLAQANASMPFQPAKATSPFTPQQAYNSVPQPNKVANLID